MIRFHLALALTLIALGARSAAAEPGPSAAERAVHERAIVLDTHLDTPVHFGRPGWNILTRHSLERDFSQVDQPRMVEGGLDGGFFVIFTEQGDLTPEGYAAARTFALMRAVQIREAVARSGGALELAFTAEDARRIAKVGKRIVYQSLENSYPLGTDPTLLRSFQALGVRMVGPVHLAANQFADSSTDAPKWNGLSPLGRELVAEANRLGMVVDASHASDQAFDQMLALSKTPIILSHSGLKSTCDHPRSLDDERLKRLAAAGGVIQLSAVDFFMVCTDWRKRAAVLGELDERFGLIENRPENGAADRARLLRERERQFADHGDFDRFMAGMLHAIKVAGVDHVGLGVD